MYCAMHDRSLGMQTSIKRFAVSRWPRHRATSVAPIINEKLGAGSKIKLQDPSRRAICFVVRRTFPRAPHPRLPWWPLVGGLWLVFLSHRAKTEGYHPPLHG